MACSPPICGLEIGQAYTAFLAPKLNGSREGKQALMGMERVLTGEKEFAAQFFHDHQGGTVQWKLYVIRTGRSGAIARVESRVADSSELRAGHDNIQSELTRGRAEILSIAARVLRAQEEERRHIARELHDNINQKLAALSLLIHDASQEARQSLPSLASRLKLIQTNMSSVIDEIRSVSHSLHPAVLEHMNLLGTISDQIAEFERLTGINVCVQLPDELELPLHYKTCLFRILQEALQNCARHSHVSGVTVVLRRVKGSVQLLIEDNGTGFDVSAAQASPGLGTISIRERVALFHGSFEVHSKMSHGTSLLVELPVPLL